MRHFARQVILTVGNEVIFIEVIKGRRRKVTGRTLLWRVVNLQNFQDLSIESQSYVVLSTIQNTDIVVARKPAGLNDCFM